MLAHYTLLKLAVPAPVTMSFDRSDLVNIYVKVPDENYFGSSVATLGEINDHRSSVGASGRVGERPQEGEGQEET